MDDDDAIIGAPDESLFDQLRQAREQHQQQQTVDLAVPGFGGQLVATYRALPWAETRKIAAAHSRVPDVATRELYIAADTLLSASITTHAVIGEGRPRDLGVRLGADLVRRLRLPGFEDESMTNRQAMFVLFGRDTQLVTHYGDLMQWQGGDADPAVDEALMRDFGEASS